MAAAKPVQLPVDSRTVRLSSPDRVLWPEVGITKQELAEYIVAVGPGILAAFGDRPVTLERYPGGVDGEVFFSKNPPKGAPDYARSVPVVYPSGRSHPQLVIDEVATAVWAVQMNTVTFHPWPVRTADVDQPDEFRIDLDPQPGRDFGDAVAAAHLLRTLLAELGLTAFAKTSGNRGIHVFARIRPEYEFLDVRHATIGIGRELARRDPDLVTMEWWKELRGSKVFVDFNQANRDRTIAGAYSPRPLPHAPVSMPVAWEDLSSVEPSDFTVRTVPALFAAREDPWGAMNSSPGSLAAALDLWEADLGRGLGEMPFPPDYPKMPGEPKRVQPSKARSDTEGLETENLYADPARWEGHDPEEVSRQRRTPAPKKKP